MKSLNFFFEFRRKVKSHYAKPNIFRCENIILGCTHDVSSYNSFQCCHKIFGNRIYVTDLATMCVSTAKQQPLEEIFASQVYGLTVYLKTNTRDRFGNTPSYLGNVLKKDTTNVFFCICSAWSVVYIVNVDSFITQSSIRLSLTATLHPVVAYFMLCPIRLRPSIPLFQQPVTIWHQVDRKRNFCTCDV